MRIAKVAMAFSVVLAISSCAFWFMGYQQGARNQVYFDAPAKIHFLSVPQEDLQERVAAFVFKQRCIVGKWDRVASWSAYHPIHSDVRRQFHDLVDRVCIDEACGCEVVIK